MVIMLRVCDNSYCLGRVINPENMGQHLADIIVSTLELPLSCSTRFDNRQFHTRTNLNKDHVAKFQEMLQAYFRHEKHLVSDIPSVAECGDHMGMSRAYLRDLLKEETRTSSSTPTTRWAKSPTASGSSTPTFQQGVQGQNGREPSPIPQSGLNQRRSPTNSFTTRPSENMWKTT